jgi:hypothetical protein
MLKIVKEKVAPEELLKLCQDFFGTMVKFVVDIKSGIVAVGGEMHSDEEALLLQQGSRQADLWGGNLYPWNDSENRIEFTSFINIRPVDDNASMEILDDAIKNRTVEIVSRLLLAPDDRWEYARP